MLLNGGPSQCSFNRVVFPEAVLYLRVIIEPGRIQSFMTCVRIFHVLSLTTRKNGFPLSLFSYSKTHSRFGPIFILRSLFLYLVSAISNIFPMFFIMYSPKDAIKVVCRI
jgi:hypothetical protein